MPNTNPLEQSVRESLERYFADLGDSQPRDILAMVIHYVERPVLEIALEKPMETNLKPQKCWVLHVVPCAKKLLAHNIQP